MRPGLAARLSRILAARLSRKLAGCYPPRWRQRYAAELLEVLGQHRPTARTVLNLAGRLSRILAARLSRKLAGCYPPRWRQRYAAELLEVLGQHRPTARTVLNLAVGAVSAHLDPAWRAGRHPMIGLRRWAPVLYVVAVVLLVPAAGLGFGALKEMYGPPMPISGGTSGTAFSPDGRTVAVIDPTLEVWDVADRAHPKLADYSHGDDTVGGADPAFSPDGRVLATGGGAVTLWNVADPARLTQIAVLPAYPGGANGQVNAVAFSPDGRIVAGAPAAGDTLALWALP